MKTKRGLAVLLLALAVGLVPGALEGQRGAGFRGQGAGPHAGRSLSLLLENGEDLGLSEDQLARIRELKAIVEEGVTPLAEEITALRAKIRTGEVDRGEGYRQLQALRGELLIASAPLRGTVQEILTVEQHRRLQAEMRRSRPGRGGGPAFGRGQADARMRRGGVRGPRGGAGFGPGFRRTGWDAELGSGPSSFRHRRAPESRWAEGSGGRRGAETLGTEPFPSEVIR